MCQHEPELSCSPLPVISSILVAGQLGQQAGLVMNLHGMAYQSVRYRESSQHTLDLTSHASDLASQLRSLLVLKHIRTGMLGCDLTLPSTRCLSAPAQTLSRCLD